MLACTQFGAGTSRPRSAFRFPKLLSCKRVREIEQEFTHLRSSLELPPSAEVDISDLAQITTRERIV